MRMSRFCLRGVHLVRGRFSLFLPLFLLLCSPAWSQTHSVVVRLEVAQHDGKPYSGQVMLQPKGGGKALAVEVNEYGLAFASLAPATGYSVSFPGIGRLSSFTSPARGEKSMELKLRLPKKGLRGASAGRGVVLFTYTDTLGRAWRNAELVCRSAKGKVYRKRTQRDGTLRMELPLGEKYWFSVRGAKNFETHVFKPEPALQTAEISLRLGNRQTDGARLNPKPKSKRSKQGKRGGGHKPPRRKPRKVMVSMPTDYIRTKKDSMGYARRSMKAAAKGKRRAALVVPSREKHKPIVAKKVRQGVLMMRAAYRELERKDPNLGRKVGMELFRPLLRSDFQDVVFVIDVTCSMDQYIEEYLLWLSLANNQDRVQGCVFFNDGDGRPNAEKKDGQTGGIRSCSSNLDSTSRCLVESIAYGCSGDDPENDVEALLYAQSRFPNASALILVADNNSAVRDMALLRQVQMPVHVFLCGVESFGGTMPPQEDYVGIASRTGGTLHTLRDDINQRALVLNGKEIRLGSHQYRVLKGRFRRIR